MSQLSYVFGYWYRLSENDGRFVWCSQPPGDCDNVACVTGAPDTENVITQAMNSVAMIPTGESRRWVVNGVDLLAAFRGGTKIALTPA